MGRRRSADKIDSTTILRHRGRKEFTIEIIGWQPYLLNDLIGVHWAVKARRKKGDAQVIAAEVKMAGVSVASGPREVQLDWIMGPQSREPDEDNVWKSLLDGLVQCQALVDDCRHFCRKLPVRFVRAAEKGIRVTLTDV